MQYDVNTPAEYLEALDEDWRKEKLLELRELIFEKAPGLKEGIRYKMLSYEDDRGVPFQLNAQRGYVSFYVGDASKIDSTGELLEGINVGKGCLRFKKSNVLANTRMDEFIQKAIELWQAGEDIDC
ncbi:MAG: DUF1801 domain-containing protein [Roseivirga sp.]|nr:DUF1801 domain-containing protein [Roseivirga sp.]